MPSAWVTFRDKAEAFVSHLFQVVEPVAEQALIKTGQDVAAAALSGTAHGSHDMIQVAVQSLKSQVPHLSVTVTTALAAAVVHDAAAAAAQAADEPLNKPPALADASTGS